MKNKNIYDVIIIGGSYSGLAAAMALGRALKNVLVLDAGLPCNRQTPHSHNFLTNDGKTPAEIAATAKQQVMAYPTVAFFTGEVTNALKTEDGFKVNLKQGETFFGRKLIFATGIKDVLPGISGLSECWGISVLHCPYCHGYEVKGLPTAVLNNSETGFEIARLIRNWTDDLTIVTNGTASFSEEQWHFIKTQNIRVITETIIRMDHMQGYLSGITFTNGSSLAIKAAYTRAPFVQHSPLPEKLGCEITPEGYIKTNTMQQTTVGGVYACGDSISPMRAVAHAVFTGTMAGISASKELIFDKY
ncbi:MAG: NAD(P)/FAD-dependent oxidoreductase [Bacteroidia bacterium]